MRKCKKCGEEFPLEAIVDGKARNLQRRKFCLSCSPFGRHNTKNLEYETIDATAKFVPSICKKHGAVEFVRDCKGYRCKKCRSEAVTKSRVKRKEKLVAHFGGRCELCGYNKYQGSLEFHHVCDKKFSLSQQGLCKSWEVMLSEANKCVLVCANCHAEVGNGVTEVPEHLLKRCYDNRGKS
ncbi:MAG: hypothetical protein M0R80_00920 [Proteobacteria bacterium]|nr:hypothetical protein [Pseudomonadota bacterium]